MKTSTAIVISVGILAAVLLIIGMCALATELIIDENTPQWKPVPGTSTYDWQ